MPKAPLNLETLARLRKQADEKKERAKTRFKESIQYKEQIAAHILRGEESTEITAEIARVSYYNLVQHYYHKDAFPITKADTHSVWKRVSDCCKLAQVSPGRYMHPMFEMYHRAFGRPPKPFELTTEKAVARVRNYYDKGILECVDEPAPTNPTDQRVSLPSKSVSVKSQPLSHQTSSSTDLTSTTRLQTEAMLPVPVAQAASSRYVPIPKNELFLLAEQQIQRIMRRQKMTREDVYKTLVIPGDVYLPPAFLKQDPAYARALSDQ